MRRRRRRQAPSRPSESDVVAINAGDSAAHMAALAFKSKILQLTTRQHWVLEPARLILPDASSAVAIPQSVRN
jgi:hypothetical protein